MTDEQLLIIEARAGVLKTTMPYPAMWNLDSNAIDFIRDDVPALVDEVRRLKAEIDKHKQWEQMAVDHFGDVESAGMAAHSEALILFESMKAQLYPESEATPDQTTIGVVLQISNMVAGLRDERNHLRREVERFELIGDDADTIESLIHRLRLTMDDGDLHGVDEQIPQMRFILREAIAPLVAETKRSRAGIERIGHERDQMVAANVELQERLSATIEVLEFGEFVVLNAQQYLPGATGIERDANKFMDQCDALVHAKEDT